MAVLSQVMQHTPLVGSGLSIPENSRKRFIAKWVDAKEVRNTNWADWAKRRSGTFEQIDIEVGASYAPFIRTTLAAQAGNGDEQLVFSTTALLRKGDQLKIEELYGGSTVEYDDTKTERATIISVDSATLATVQRHEGEVADGSYRVHPSGSRVTVVSRAQNYNEPFPDAITFRGDSLTVYPQRFDSGEITYDLAATKVPDFEAPTGHYMGDVMYWKNELPVMRNDALINGRKVAPNYNASPKIPGRLSGCIWWAEQVGTNVVPIGGQLNIFDFSDIFEDLAVNHTDGPGDAIWGSPRMVSIWNEMLLPFKGQFGPGDTTFDMRTTGVKSAFGNVGTMKTDNRWPNSKILLTSRADWEWGDAQDMDWLYVERDAANLGGFQKSWTMGGDFAQVCLNVSHQRLMTGIDTRKDLYPARTAFL